MENPTLSKAIEFRRRLSLPETRDAVISQMVGEYFRLKDWRKVADHFQISHRTMSRFLDSFPALRLGAERARAEWDRPHGLAGYNAERAARLQERERA